mgnify:CR=1 FL=1
MIWIIIAGAIWGATNILLKKGTNYNLGFKALPEFLNSFLHPYFLVPYLLNQSGSLIFYWQLGQIPLKVAVPVVNSIAFIIPVLFDSRTTNTFIGTALVILGISLCISA